MTESQTYRRTPWWSHNKMRSTKGPTPQQLPKIFNPRSRLGYWTIHSVSKRPSSLDLPSLAISSCATHHLQPSSPKYSVLDELYSGGRRRVRSCNGQLQLPVTLWKQIISTSSLWMDSKRETPSLKAIKILTVFDEHKRYMIKWSSCQNSHLC